MTSNPPYDIIKQTIKEEIMYDYELVKSLKTNPSYEVIQKATDWTITVIMRPHNQGVMMLFNQTHLAALIQNHLE